MEITITHTVAPELLRILSKIADALSMTKTFAPIESTGQKAPEPAANVNDTEKETKKAKPRKPTTAPTDDAPLTLEAVRAEIAEKINQGKREEFKEILNSFGVEKLTDLSEDLYPEILEKVRGL